MPLKTSVVVGNITNLSDARYCAGMGVDILAFPIDGDFAISVEDFEGISGWVAGVSFAAEILGNTIPDTKGFEFDFMIVRSPEMIQQVHAIGNKPILMVDISDFEKWLDNLELWRVEHFILSHSSTYEEPMLVSILQQWTVDHSIYLNAAGGTQDLQQILDTGINGLYLLGQNEAQPGSNDYDKLIDILEFLEIDE